MGRVALLYYLPRRNRYFLGRIIAAATAIHLLFTSMQVGYHRGDTLLVYLCTMYLLSPWHHVCELRPFPPCGSLVAPKWPFGKNYGENCGSVP